MERFRSMDVAQSNIYGNLSSDNYPKLLRLFPFETNSPSFPPRIVQ